MFSARYGPSRLALAMPQHRDAGASAIAGWSSRSPAATSPTWVTLRWGRGRLRSDLEPAPRALAHVRIVAWGILAVVPVLRRWRLLRVHGRGLLGHPRRVSGM